MKMTEAQFRIKYDGNEPDYHEIDAALLSQALMGFSEMGRAAYRIMHPEDTHKLHVKVNALSAGSFNIDLEATIPAIEHLYGQVVGLFNRSDVQAAATAVGFAGTIASAFDFTKRLAGRKHNVKVDGDNTTITTADGETFTIPTVVYNIAGDATFLQSAEQALKPLDDDNYSRMEIQDHNGRVLDTIRDEDRGYFKKNSDALESDQTLRLEVAIETVQVGAPDRVWTFRSGDQRFNAKVLDEDFLHKVKTIGYRINTNSRAIVDRREVRKKDSSGVTKTQYSIMKVHQLTNPDEQPTLF